MLTPDLADRIRAIFLHRGPNVTNKEGAALLGCSIAEFKVAIAAGEVETCDTCRGPRVPLHEVATLARSRWQIVAIEEALGADAQAILPTALWTRPITLRLSAYHVQMLDHFARQAGLPADAIAARAFDDFMSANAEGLAEVIDDYRVALDWPEADDVTPRA